MKGFIRFFRERDESPLSRRKQNESLSGKANVFVIAPEGKYLNEELSRLIIIFESKFQRCGRIPGQSGQAILYSSCKSIRFTTQPPHESGRRIKIPRVAGITCQPSNRCWIGAIDGKNLNRSKGIGCQTRDGLFDAYPAFGWCNRNNIGACQQEN